MPFGQMNKPSTVCLSSQSLTPTPWRKRGVDAVAVAVAVLGLSQKISPFEGQSDQKHRLVTAFKLFRLGFALRDHF